MVASGFVSAGLGGRGSGGGDVGTGAGDGSNTGFGAQAQTIKDTRNAVSQHPHSFPGRVVSRWDIFKGLLLN
jgi:hypothetical protein